MKTVTSKLTDIGEWLGADPMTYINIRLYFEELEASGDVAAQDFLWWFDKVHAVMQKVKDGQ